ncbi:ribonuclease III [Microcoleus sp. LAD1_D5]|uniref:ribonuclease III n=1 Tax=Microcoleus TaxID=44471 RepID=UPI001683AE34|nr:ribonuclease III [Microcoleus sp. FACHB-DQ6]UNU24994.1 ribonuclease III [Microcoleus vaginatus HSN003]
MPLTNPTQEIEITLPEFHHEKLLRQALTHRSYVNENPTFREEDNERLEFLGDALLTFLSGEYLYQRHPEMGEDQLTRRRSALVDEKQLARFATEIGLDLKMRLGKGAYREGGITNPNLLSSTFEAFIGAYYLDTQDMDKVRNFVQQMFDSVPENVVETRSTVDSKNRFQEWVQANGDTTPPKYVTVQAGGTPHKPEFLAKVYVAEKLYGEGKGKSKKDAEKNAAEDALAKLKKRGLI